MWYDPSFLPIEFNLYVQAMFEIESVFLLCFVLDETNGSCIKAVMNFRCSFVILFLNSIPRIIDSIKRSSKMILQSVF